MQMDLCDELHYSQSPVALYTKLDAECDQADDSRYWPWQHLATSIIAKCCQQQTDNFCLFITLGDGGHAAAKFSIIGPEFGEKF